MTNGKPNVFPFSTPNAYYAYDVATGKIVEIGKSLFQLFLNDLPSEEAGLELAAQQAAGNFIPFFPSLEKHPLFDYLEDIIDRNMAKITLQVTQNCNFRCSYCPYTSNSVGFRTHNSKRMSLDVALRSIDFAKEHSIDTKEFLISFYGGEPLLEYKLIKKVVEYSKQVLLGKKLVFNFTTNASLITDEMAEFFEENDFELIVSLDGPKQINDRNRKLASGGGSAFKATMGALERIHDHYPKLFEKTMCNMVMDPSCDLDEYYSLTSLYPFLTDRIRVSILDDDHMENKIPVSDVFFEKNQYYSFLEILTEIGRYDIQLLPNIKVCDKYRVVNTEYKIDSLAFLPLRTEDFPGGQCIPGAHAPMVTVDGRIAVCERINENLSVLEVGDIYSGFRYDSAKKILNSAGIKQDVCRHCFALKFCDLCVNDCVQGDEFTPVRMLKRCESIRGNAEYRIIRRTLLKELPKFYAMSCLGEKK